MQIKYVFFLVLLFLMIDRSPLWAQLRKIRFSNSAISISELPFKVAQLKGFYREEGLNVEAILIRGAVGMQALLGASVDYTSASGSTIATAVRVCRSSSCSSPRQSRNSSWSHSLRSSPSRI
jgi:ABC-type nitrate/sulfonate/bicarbonate transport system substrate-binding protein